MLPMACAVITSSVLNQPSSRLGEDALSSERVRCLGEADDENKHGQPGHSMVSAKHKTRSELKWNQPEGSENAGNSLVTDCVNECVGLALLVKVPIPLDSLLSPC